MVKIYTFHISALGKSYMISRERKLMLSINQVDIYQYLSDLSKNAKMRKKIFFSKILKLKKKVYSSRYTT